MGTWGIKHTENDLASDWLIGLEKTLTVSYLSEPIMSFSSNKNVDNSDAIQLFLAASEIIAYLLDRDESKLPTFSYIDEDELDELTVSEELKQSTLKGLDYILTDTTNELYHLYSQENAASLWLEEVNKTKQRITSTN
ncbi:DUF4259 domain-containing protein (plasmid) [Bernardetia sp. Wsw4-3y2]|uniref:DUF4259 domain-containing protein n=1 Tax=Bernardetia sp. Wsw4-3y2 TaxID=3127471 RepID=UPI0030CD9B4F